MQETGKNQLEKARETINSVDEQMAKLFLQRMESVKEIAAYKQEKNLPVTDEEREKIVTERNVGAYPNEETKSYYASFLQNVMELSKQYQKKLRE